jgi:hypothetical protein
LGLGLGVRVRKVRLPRSTLLEAKEVDIIVPSQLPQRLTNPPSNTIYSPTHTCSTSRTVRTYHKTLISIQALFESIGWVDGWVVIGFSWWI